MFFLIIIFIILCFYNFRIIDNKENYLSKENTNMIKGLFVFWVFIRHVIPYVNNFSSNWYDSWVISFDNKLAQTIVVMFMFYSGYGISESIRIKGNVYIEKIPRNRILKTFFNFMIAVTIYAIIDVILNINDISIKNYILALTGWISIGNSNWYIFTIIFMYIFTWISYLVFKKKNKALIFNIILSFFYMLVLFKLKGSYWYDSIVGYLIGMIFSNYKTSIERFLNNNFIEILGFLICGIGVVICAYFELFSKNVVFALAYNSCFCILFVLISRRVKLNSKILKYMGENLFPIYMYMRVPMIILKSTMNLNAYIYIILSALITYLIVIIYNKINKLKEVFYASNDISCWNGQKIKRFNKK